MNYTIQGYPNSGYTVEFSHTWPKLLACPCCDKPILTLRKAYLIAENLTLIAKGTPT